AGCARGQPRRRRGAGEDGAPTPSPAGTPELSGSAGPGASASQWSLHDSCGTESVGRLRRPRLPPTPWLPSRVEARSSLCGAPTQSFLAPAAQKPQASIRQTQNPSNRKADRSLAKNERSVHLLTTCRVGGAPD